MRTVSFLPDLLSQGPWQPLTNADDYVGREVMALERGGSADILLLQYDEPVMDIVAAWAWQSDGIHPVSLSYVARLLGDQIYPEFDRSSTQDDAVEDAAWDENERRSR